MIAIARRLFGVLPVLAGILCLFWPGPGIWRLEIVDYGAEYKERVEYAQKMAEKRAKEGGKPLVVQPPDLGGLDHYVQKKTRVSLKEVESQAWEDLYEKTSKKKRYLHLTADTPPLNSLDRTDGRDFFNLQLPDRYPKFLAVTLVPITSPYLGPEVTWGMKHPFAFLTPWLIVLGLAVYIFLPRPKLEAGVFRYSRLRSQIGVDLLAVFLGGIFLVLPLFIVSQFAGDPHPLSKEGGKVVVTLIFWFIALISLVNLAVSTWYEGLYFRLTREGVSKVNLFKTREFPFSEMINLSRTVMDLPSWAKSLAWMTTAFNLGLSAPMILASQSEAPFVRVGLHDGRELLIMTKHLVGWEELERSLRDSGLEYESKEGREG